jgi:S-adenosylmethionine-diacylglycerol 3-amino-3-carboxypropyl transferase
MGHYIDERADFGIIRYANCWEDADVLCAALQPAPGKRILSIASAGDNSLALLADGSEVVAADLSPVQLACVELRMAAFRELNYDETLAFLGVRESTQRLQNLSKAAGRLVRRRQRLLGRPR